ncbi:hypothetical protein PHJA_002832200 [Phtheirospermum japonicum]|uniref:Uncharacterized protein n=1 Tax=Phtheirospermum japonicum TaxID=374723 RepID=A0A830DLZ7_9LAMI|nr:hypothetical protein PHJA_002832200 [Phtheirospermum japonicum]
MAFSAPPSATGRVQNPSGSRKPLGFLAIAKKRKHSFIQFAAMTGILLLSCRSLGQKYRIHDLTEDTVALIEDQESLSARMNLIKRSLLAEAALEPTGNFAARLRLLFGDESN